MSAGEAFGDHDSDGHLWAIGMERALAGFFWQCATLSFVFVGSLVWVCNVSGRANTHLARCLLRIRLVDTHGHVIC